MIKTNNMRKATEILKKHWQKVTDQRFDEVTEHHLNYAIEAIEEALNENNINGTLLLHDLFAVGNIKNEDGMAVVEFLDKPNGGSVAYLRYDAVVKRVNELLKEKTIENGIDIK